MVDALKGHPVRLRAHAKSHKCPEIARHQIALSAVDLCCQKLSEAAVFVDAGITGAGTGTFLLEHDSGVFNENQAGSYIFMDRDYGDNQPESHPAHASGLRRGPEGSQHRFRHAHDLVASGIQVRKGRR